MSKLSLIVIAALLATATPDAAPQAGAPEGLRPAWNAALGDARGGALAGCAAVGPRVLVIDDLGGVTALDPASGELQWFVQAPAPLDFVPSDGAALALSAAGRLVVVDARSGRRLLELDRAQAPAGSACSDGQRVYVPSLLGPALVAFDLASGMQAWEFRFESPFVGPAQVCGREGSRSVLVAFEDGTLRAVPAQGEVPRGERWVARPGVPVGTPLKDGEHIVLATLDRTVVALDEASGQVRWRHFPGEIPRSAVVRAGDVLAYATATRLVALDPASGATRWTVPGGGRPLGDAGGGLLVRTAAGCEWRHVADGRLLQEGLPANAVAVAGRLIELRDRRGVAGWRAPGR